MDKKLTSVQNLLALVIVSVYDCHICAEIWNKYLIYTVDDAINFIF